MQVQYRNCNYIGGFQQYVRQGFGMLLFDNSNILIAKWNNNLIDGPYAYLSDKLEAYGTMLQGKLQGYNMITVKQSLIKSNGPSNKQPASQGQQKSLYCMFRDNHPYGKFVLTSESEAIFGHYVQGEVGNIDPEKARSQRQILNLLQKNFPNRHYKIEEFLYELLNQVQKSAPIEEHEKYIPSVINFENNIIFYGYQETLRRNKGIGFTRSRAGEIMTIGEHEDMYLQGLGRAYKKSMIQDGVFKGGVLNGVGIRYYIGQHRYQLGQYGKGEGIEKGFGFPGKEISEIRKEFHLRAIQFYNDIVVLSVATLFEAIINNIVVAVNQKDSQRRPGIREDSRVLRGSGFGDKPLLKNKLDKYDYENEYIEETSPIKEPLDSYSRAEFPHKDSVGGKYSQKYEGNRSREKSRSKKSLGRQRAEQDERETKSGKKFKDTKVLVKQLDERERNKRNYLDQIYKEVNLYKKK